MKQGISLAWKKGMAFETQLNGHTLTVDADHTNGGNDLGPRPKALMLVALAGCTGMDIVSILEKMRVDIVDLNVKVDGDLTEEHPKHFINMHITYEFWGKELPEEKLQKAISLSDERYCGVAAVYKKVMPVTHSIIIHEV